MAQALIAVPTQDFLQKTLGAQLLEGVTAAATFNNVTGIQNLPGVFIVDRIDTNEIETPNKREVIKFSGTSGSTVTTLVRGLAGTTDQDHAVGAIVEFVPDIIWAQSVYDSITQIIDPATGTVDLTKVVTATGTQTLTNKTLTLPVIASISNGGTVTLPSGAVTLVARTTTDTLTNKRITKRAPAITQSATPTINTDNTDVAHITGLAQAITSMTTNLSGTPVEGDTLRIDITDNGTARAITWGASFEASGTVALPTTTVVNVRLDVGFVWNSVTSKWRCVAVA